MDNRSPLRYSNARNLSPFSGRSKTDKKFESSEKNSIERLYEEIIPNRKDLKNKGLVQSALDHY